MDLPVTGIIMADGEVHRNNRRLTLQVLKDFGMGKTGIEKYVNVEIQVLVDTFMASAYDLCTSNINIFKLSLTDKYCWF